MCTLQLDSDNADKYVYNDFLAFFLNGTGFKACLEEEKNCKCFWKFGREPHQLPMKQGKLVVLFLTAVAIAIVVGYPNKLAEVLVHVLGVKKCLYSLGNSAGKASNFQPKNRM